MQGYFADIHKIQLKLWHYLLHNQSVAGTATAICEIRNRGNSETGFFFNRARVQFAAWSSFISRIRQSGWEDEAHQSWTVRSFSRFTIAPFVYHWVLVRSAPEENFGKCTSGRSTVSRAPLSALLDYYRQQFELFIITLLINNHLVGVFCLKGDSALFKLWRRLLSIVLVARMTVVR